MRNGCWQCLPLRLWLILFHSLRVPLTRQNQNLCQMCYKQKNYLAYKRFVTLILLMNQYISMTLMKLTVIYIMHLYHHCRVQKIQCRYLQSLSLKPRRQFDQHRPK